MRKKVVDTNIFIDRLADPNRYHEIFLGEGFVCLSSVVLMELRAGAHSLKAVRAIDDLERFFVRVGRVLTPSHRDYHVAGEALASLQRNKGYDLKKAASLANDCLIAATSRTQGATLYTQNQRDFAAIREVFDFSVVFASVVEQINKTGEK